MKHKSGLHKKVSSIFGGTSFLDEASAKTPLADNDAASAAKPPHQYYAPAAKTFAKAASFLTENHEYESSQRRKLFLVIGLSVVFVLVLFFNFVQFGKKTDTSLDGPSAQVMPVKVSEIYWPEPEIWSADIRDPMVFKEDAARLYALESKIKGPFVLRGIVHKPESGSTVLIGTEILSEGDEIDGWTIGEISPESVKLKKPDGEEMELKMEDR